MADRPILFQAPMVRALLDGRKTQTRRIIKDAPSEAGWICYQKLDGERMWVGPNGYPSMPCVARFAKGDRLWVRETFRLGKGYDGVSPANAPTFATVWYEATGEDSPVLRTPIAMAGPKRVAIHMPRWASRLTLTVTDVRVERLQAISETDAIAEGIERVPAPHTGWRHYSERDGLPGIIAVDSYKTLWNSINGAGAWDVNSWVVAVTFEVKKGNIDA